MNRSVLSRQGWWPAVVLLAFGAIYAGSLTFAYAEGDDAESIAYHALGRSAAWPPFSAYQSGADLLLRVLPANEPLIRVVAISSTSIAMAACVVLMLALAFDLLGDLAPSKRGWVALAVMLAMPELFYLGLVYHPSVIGLCLALPAHLILRRALREQEAADQWTRTMAMKALLAAVLLGTGAAIRWTLVMYGWLIVCDWILGVGRKPPGSWREYVHRVRSVTVWGLTASAAWWAGVAASGYGLKDILAYPSFARQWMAYEYEWHVVVGQTLSVFTPALIVLTTCGVVFLVRRQARLVVFVGIAVVPVLPLIAWADPKQYLWSFPVLVLTVTAGCVALAEWGETRAWGRVMRFGVGALLVLPWAVGARATYGDTAWGPGFEVRPYDRPQRDALRFSIVLGAGAAVPTPEGPRPLWGHGAVLLGGEWRRFSLRSAEERARVVATAASGSLPILVLQGTSGSIACELARSGFGTVEMVSGEHGALKSVRRFTNRDGQAVLVLKLHSKLREFSGDAGSIRQVIKEAGSDQVIATGYPESLRTIYRAAPASMRAIGSSAAVVSLKQLGSR